MSTFGSYGVLSKNRVKLKKAPCYPDSEYINLGYRHVRLRTGPSRLFGPETLAVHLRRRRVFCVALAQRG